MDPIVQLNNSDADETRVLKINQNFRTIANVIVASTQKTTLVNAESTDSSIAASVNNATAGFTKQVNDLNERIRTLSNTVGEQESAIKSLTERLSRAEERISALEENLKPGSGGALG